MGSMPPGDYNRLPQGTWNHDVPMCSCMGAALPCIKPFAGKAGCLKQGPFSPFSLLTGGSRGLVHGRLWRRDGVLAVTCAQEGVIRLKPRVSESKL